MPFTPFNQRDFEQTAQLSDGGNIEEPLATKIAELRNGLDAFPEFKLDFFRRRLVRRPRMKGADRPIFGDPERDEGDRLVFGAPKVEQGHWYLVSVGGDQDEVQLNIGMFEEYVRVGMGFIFGKQMVPKIPAFRVLQSFLGMRPPLPFREHIHRTIKRNEFQIEGVQTRDADETMRRLETHVVHADDGVKFFFLGAIWGPDAAISKSIDDYHHVFHELMPFYEELLLAGGRYRFYV